MSLFWSPYKERKKHKREVRAYATLKTSYCCVFISAGIFLTQIKEEKSLCVIILHKLSDFPPSSLKIAENISFIYSAVLTHIHRIDISTKTPQKREFHSIHVKDRSDSAVWLRLIKLIHTKIRRVYLSQQLWRLEWVREHRTRYQSVNINTWITEF